MTDNVAAEVAGLRSDFAQFKSDIRVDLVRLEAKIDSKPSLMAMFTAVMIVVFGMAGVIASTVTVLHTLGFIGRWVP